LRVIPRSNWQKCQKAQIPIKKMRNFGSDKIIKYETAKIIDNHIKKQNAFLFIVFNKAVNTHSRCTRFAKLPNLRLPLFKTKRNQQSIKYTGVKIWKFIPDQIRNHYFTKFKKENKKQQFTS